MTSWAIQIIGADGCGKSTIAAKLAKSLNDFTQEPKTTLVHEPDRKLDSCRQLYDIAFKDITCTTVARELLLLASRSISTMHTYMEGLRHGNIISDRSFMCGYAYNKIKCALPPYMWWEFSKKPWENK